MGVCIMFWHLPSRSGNKAQAKPSRPAGRRLILEPLEDRTLPSVMPMNPAISSKPITFSKPLLVDFKAFLTTSTIETMDVDEVTKLATTFFKNLRASAPVSDQPALDTILGILDFISSHDTITLETALGLRKNIDSYLADKPTLNETYNNEVGNIPIKAQVAGPLVSEIENTLAAAAAPSSDQQPVPGSVPAVVPFGFFVRLVQTAIKISGGQLTSLDLARVSSELQNPGQRFQFVAPATGQLLVQLSSTDAAHQGVSVLDASGKVVPPGQGGTLFINEGQTYSIQVRLGNGVVQYDLTLALVVMNPAVHEPTSGETPSTGSAAGHGSVGSVPQSANFLLVVLTGSSIPIS